MESLIAFLSLKLFIKAKNTKVGINGYKNNFFIFEYFAMEGYNFI